MRHYALKFIRSLRFVAGMSRRFTFHIEGQSWKQISAALTCGFTMRSQRTANAKDSELHIISSQPEGKPDEVLGHEGSPEMLFPRPERRASDAKCWNKRYRNRLRLSDLAIISMAVAGAQFLRFGTGSEDHIWTSIPGVDVRITYTLLSLLLILGWMFSLSILGARDYRMVGTGVQEYKLVIDATVTLFGALAIVDLMFKLSISRGYLMISFPVGLVLLLSSRWLWRSWLYRKRRRGKYLDCAVVVGDSDKSEHVSNQISRAPVPA